MVLPAAAPPAVGRRVTADDGMDLDRVLARRRGPSTRGDTDLVDELHGARKGDRTCVDRRGSARAEDRRGIGRGPTGACRPPPGAGTIEAGRSGGLSRMGVVVAAVHRRLLSIAKARPSGRTPAAVAVILQPTAGTPRAHPRGSPQGTRARPRLEPDHSSPHRLVVGVPGRRARRTPLLTHVGHRGHAKSRFVAARCTAKKRPRYPGKRPSGRSSHAGWIRTRDRRRRRRPGCRPSTAPLTEEQASPPACIPGARAWRLPGFIRGDPLGAAACRATAHACPRDESLKEPSIRHRFEARVVLDPRRSWTTRSPRMAPLSARLRASRVPLGPRHPGHVCRATRAGAGPCQGPAPARPLRLVDAGAGPTTTPTVVSAGISGAWSSLRSPT